MDPEKRFTKVGVEIQQPGNTGNNTPSLNKLPGSDPFTHDAQPGLSGDKLITTQQKTTLFTAEETNRYYHTLLRQGIAALNLSFDLPTQHGHDSEHADSEGKVGRLGVNVNSLDDMEILFKGIRLQDISIHLDFSPTGFILLAFIIALAKKQGADLAKLRGSIRNDILQEYITGGNYIYPVKPSMRIITDMFEWCTQELPHWNIISVSGYHTRETGSNAAQEIALALSNGKAYVTALLAKGLDLDMVSSKLFFLFGMGDNLFEEVAKLRAAKLLWTVIMKEFGAINDQSMMLRFFIKTGESLPTADPSSGDKSTEALTEALEKKATELIATIDSMGGSAGAIEKGFMQIKRLNNVNKAKTGTTDDKRIITGSNNFFFPESTAEQGFGPEKSIRQVQIDKLESLRRRRNPARCDSILQGLNDSAAGDENIMPAVLEAVENNCTLGEIADTLREVYGEYRSQV